MFFEQDIKHFHRTCKSVCDAHDSTFYATYKEKCDTYFWNTHRNEARGVGGLFLITAVRLRAKLFRNGMILLLL
jgi:coproporphyrinogen III oxidase